MLFLVCLPSIDDKVTGETNDIQTMIADIFHYAAGTIFCGKSLIPFSFL